MQADKAYQSEKHRIDKEKRAESNIAAKEEELRRKRDDKLKAQ
jgi:hypothetical protein